VLKSFYVSLLNNQSTNQPVNQSTSQRYIDLTNQQKKKLFPGKLSKEGEKMFVDLGVQAAISIISHSVFIIITWRALQSIRFDVLFKKHKVFEVRLFMVILTIVIASVLSHFFLDLLNWSQQLLYLF
jgi:uncharacterized integral membrane protein (TIGR02327 family)